MGSSLTALSGASLIDSELIRFRGERKFAETLIAAGIIGYYWRGRLLLILGLVVLRRRCGMGILVLVYTMLFFR